MKAVVLLSGGADSTVALAMALERGRTCYALSFNYGQRHLVELKAAAKISEFYGVKQKIIHIDPSTFTKSALTTSQAVPKNRTPDLIAQSGIPSTYVPARNTLFLAYALGFAEIQGAEEIHVGFNALDYAPYPDCRPEFLNAFQAVANLATQQAIEQKAPKIIAPLIHMNKAQIFEKGRFLKAPLHLTFSCYDPTPAEQPCGQCDACVLRAYSQSSIE